MMMIWITKEKKKIVLFLVSYVSQKSYILPNISKIFASSSSSISSDVSSGLLRTVEVRFLTVKYIPVSSFFFN